MAQKHKRTKKKQQAKSKGKKRKRVQAKGPWYKQPKLLRAAALLAIITAICYLPSLQNGFVNWDDPDYVTENVVVHNINAENLRTVFTEPMAENYHPLTFLTLMVDYAVGNGDPLPFHLTNLLLHLLATIAVFVFILTIFKQNLVVAFTTALIFGIHPMHVESVAWVTERKDVLYGLFFVLGLITYARYAKTGQKKLLVITFLWYLLSMLSKPAAVTFFLVQLLIDYWYNRGWKPKVLLEKVPFLALALFFSWLTIAIQSDTSVKGLDEISFINRICAAGYGFNVYVLKFLVPFDLINLYPYPPLANPPGYFYAMPFIALAIFAAGAWYARKRKNVQFGFLFFFLTISITLQLFSFGSAILSERYTYIPYIGLAFCMGLLLDYLLKQRANRRQLIYGITGAYMLFLGISTFQQTKVWENGETLWTNTIEKMAYPSSVPNSNRGFYYKKQGKTDLALKDFERALQLYSEAHEALLGKANIQFEQGQYQQALQGYNQLISKNPNNAAALSSRSACLTQLGHYEEALQDANSALELDPYNINTMKNRALLYSAINQHELAAQDFMSYLKYEPQNAPIINSLAVEYQHLGQHDEAIKHINRAIQLEPNNGMWYNNRGISYRVLGQQPQAQQDFQKAQQLGFAVNPTYLRSQ